MVNNGAKENHPRKLLKGKISQFLHIIVIYPNFGFLLLMFPGRKNKDKEMKHSNKGFLTELS